MRFAISDEQRDFATSLDELLTAADTPAVIRAWSRQDYVPGRALWNRLAQLGVMALGSAEEHGGFGADPVTLVVAFEVLGRHGVPGPLIESIAALPALLDDPATLAGLAAGEVLATLAAPPLVPLALDGDACQAVYVLEDGQLSPATVTGRFDSVDAARHLSALTPSTAGRAVDAQAALELGTLLCAAQLVGAGDALVRRSCQYALQRSQFGRQIGSFQAVKHLLADAAVGIELARPLLYGAALSLGSPDAARDVSAARVAAGDAAYRAARNALQVHGAIGYTAEYDLSLWLTKVRALRSAWGTPREHRARVLTALR